MIDLAENREMKTRSQYCGNELSYYQQDDRLSMESRDDCVPKTVKLILVKRV